MQSRLTGLVGFFMIFLIPFVIGEASDEGGDIIFFGFELDKILNLGIGILALVLFSVTYAAYRRTRNTRLKYVNIAFALFAVKGFLITHELFFAEISWVDPLASMFDFAILLVFFFGILRR